MAALRRTAVLAAVFAIGVWGSTARLVHAASFGDRQGTAWDRTRDVVAYLYALGLERGWYRANPETKGDLEEYLWLYSEHVISPSESSWGVRYQLKPGERMVQYLLLWRAPLDVVYDSSDRIQAIFTSYE